MGKLDGKVAIITGGGTGIGAEMARLFAKEGASVAVCGRRLEPLQEVAASIAATGARSLAISGDVSCEDDVQRIVKETAEVLGPPQVLINNASIVGQVGPVVDIDADQFDLAMAINVRGPLLMCKAVLPYMFDAGWGTIVMVSSNVGRRGFPNRAPYVCSKWAMHGLTQTLAHEVGAKGVRVNAICPGPVKTDRLDGSMERMALARSVSVEDIQHEWEMQSPMGRFTTQEENARAALFFACDDSSGTTGQALNVTAGALMS